MSSEFSKLVEVLGAEIDRRQGGGTLAKAVGATRRPSVSRPATTQSPPALNSLPTDEIRRRILDAEQKIFAKALRDLEA